MQKEVLDHYLEFGLFTNPGLYKDYLVSLPNDIRELGLLLRTNFIHRTTLASGNTGTNSDLKYGDMTKIPWWRQAEDDNLTTTTAMLAEFFRRDGRGLMFDRRVEDKLVLTCRFIAILMTSILKAKGIPARVRSGFADYFENTTYAWDHWVTQYWDQKEERWITIDVDGSLHKTGFDMYDIPDNKFYFSADTWLRVRAGKLDENHFKNGGGPKGLIAISWELFYDFHCLMNNEIIYDHGPEFTFPSKFKKLGVDALNELDDFAKTMQSPDTNFERLTDIWETNKEYRLLKGGLL